MHVRSWLSFGALLVMIALPASVRAAESKKAATPALVVQIKSIDGLLADARYLANLAGKEEQAKQIDGFLQSLKKEKGFQAIDPKRPLGLYGSFAEDVQESHGAVLVPITDEKAFLDLLDRFNQKAEKGDDGIYTVTPPQSPVPFYFTFAHKYAYITAQSKTALEEKNLLDPARVLSPGRSADLYAAFQINQIPDGLKQIALQMIDQQADKAQQAQPGETQLQTELKAQAAKDMAEQAADVVKEGQTLEIQLTVDRKGGNLFAEASVAGKPGSRLASRIAKLGEAKSLFGTLAGTDSALSLETHWTLPANVRKALEPMIDDGFQKALAKEKVEAKRAEAEKVYKALEPSLKSGALDFAFSLHGPKTDNHYTFVAGIKLQDGKAVENVLRDWVKTLPEKDRQKIKLDVAEAGEVKIHQIEAQQDFDANARKTLGDHPVFFAIREDALLVTGGPGGQEALQKALAVQPQTSPLVEGVVSLARLAPLMPQPNAPEAAKEAFGGDQQDRDKVRLTVEGGKTLRAIVKMNAPVVKFFNQVNQQGGGAARPEAPATVPPETPKEK
ncbi:MAG: hypothetical protein JO112_05970 [Planctomycetes bacterium]|nr:hypothetical protein [Planctomycetota bacterium]